MSDSIAWGSTVMYSTVEHLDEYELQQLIDMLNDAVAEICENFGVR